ncbi:cellulose-binding domain-containing protein [Cellvibrio polysaccharolyticus]|uniref:Exo-alpha-sialidase n=1 Tax=Cellvibrio polysaccharolyticus TaxID=2082724 RepID=A0A928V1U7_9GAMM|nr:cellulose-binding domain-containing protein [Cellvibrio polysaccharolyticus]MBE8717241.1 exo-alpha-sialidase [Cellvibrio polysaccharolyticus]
MNIKNTLSTLLLGFSVASLGWAQTSVPYQWDSVAIGGGGFVSAIVPSKTEPDLIYARTDVGGAYRWDASNARWIPLTDWVSEEETGFLGIESIATDPQQPNRVYMLAGISYFNNGKTAILRSTDYGQNFSVLDVTSQFRAHGNGMGRQTGEKLQVDPLNSQILYAGTRWNGLFKSTNYGSTWTRLNGLNITTTPNENGISFVVLDASSSSGSQTQTLYVGVSRFTSHGANLFKSTDGGATFTAITDAPTQNMPQRAVLASDGNLYVTYADGAGPHGHWAVPEPMEAGQVWRYNTATGAWTNITPAGFTRGFGGISIDPANPARLVLSTINTWMQQYDAAYGDRILISTNRGASWTDVIDRGFAMNNNGIPWINGHAIHWTGSIEFDPFNAGRVWVSSGNGIFKTENINNTLTTWDFTVKGLEETVPLGLVSVPGGPLVSVIGDYDGFRHTDVRSYGQIHQPRMGTSTGIAVAAQNPNILVRAGGGDNPGMYYSTDMALSWTRTATMNGTNGQVALSADGAVLLHSPENSSTSYRSTNVGGSWSVVSGLTANNAFPVADPINSQRFYAYDNGRLLASSNGGVSFSQVGTLASGGSNVIRAAPGREGDIWVALHGGGLARSVNGGVSFTTISGVSHAGAVGFGKEAPGASYPAVYLWGTVAGVKGVYRSTDTGASWMRVNDNDHEYGGPGNGRFVMGDLNIFGRVYMSTAGRGIAFGEPAAGGSSSSVSSVSSLPVVSSSSVSSVSSAIVSSHSSSTSSVASGSGSCQYVVTNDWGSGFNAAIRITNNGSQPVSGWQVSWQFADATRISHSWNGELSGNNPYTLTPLSWNATIQPGTTLEVGLQGTKPGGAANIPVLTGTLCQ